MKKPLTGEQLLQHFARTDATVHELNSLIASGASEPKIRKAYHKHFSAMARMAYSVFGETPKPKARRCGK